MKILVVEDDRPIAASVCRGLEEAHYQVEWASDGNQALAMARRGHYGLIILDLMLPGRDGYAVCEALREHRDTTPILMLTARDAVPDRVRGLDVGADDYLTKPFDFAELIARVRALLRRDKVHRSVSITVGDLVIETAARRVSRAGREIVLTPREYALLCALASNEGRVLTRDVILDRVWLDEDLHPNSVNVHIGALRKKVDDGFAEKLIHTVYGFGYTLKRMDDGAA